MSDRRNLELALLGAAALPVMILFALIGVQAQGDFSWNYLTVPASLFALFIAMHLIVRFTAPGADAVLLPLTFVLTSIGIAFVIRLVPARAMNQIIWLVASVIAAAITLYIVPSLEKIGRYKYLLMLTGLILLLLPAVIGTEINGSRLWITFGGFSIQPGEIARIFIILFLAAYLAENREMLSVSTRKIFGIPLPEPRTLGPLVLMWAISFLILVGETDLGSSLLFFCIFLVMLYAATGRFSYVVVGCILFSAGAVVAYHLFAHVQTRVAIWIDPFADAMDRGYQLVQSLFAFAAGGLFGTGPGAGYPTRIPFVDTDFIFAAIGEELGLLGASAILICFLVFIYRGLSTASRAKTDMAAFTAVGLTASIAIQVFVIVGGVTSLIPLTGITVPFISRGGSSMVSSFVLLALLLRAGDESHGDAVELKAIGGGHALLGRMALAKRLGTLGIFFTILITLLIGNLTWIQVVRAESLRNNPYNTRNLYDEQRVARGSILSSDNVVLAESAPAGDGTYRRVYPLGEVAAHTIGYYSFEFGRTGVEAYANTTLTGQRSFHSWTDVIDSAMGRSIQGDDVVLTIDSRIQIAAEEAMQGLTGAVVAIDPRSGAVLASVSRPSFNPQTIDESMETLQTNVSAPLLDRARSTLLAPGSTFKVVTLTAALADGVATPDTVYSAPGVMEIGNAPVTNFDNTSYGDISLITATAYSVNTVFGQLAVELGADRLVSQAERFGFNQDIPYTLEIVTSLMPEPSEMTTWETAWAGIGQPVGEQSYTHPSPAGPQATVFQMALVAAGIANGGEIMQPYLIDHTQSSDGTQSLLGRTSPRRWLTATDPATAAKIGEVMKATVASGAGAAAQIEGVTIAGKTGTAESGQDREPDGWFIVYAPADDPVIAIAIVIEQGGLGGYAAAPIARPMLEAALMR
ncbi:MAG: FtsW/RodA/SpoVE family cell cycle protein [Coriobacteriia bacterium]|nr:FtsW/RodA/SpoVE family cell cycle protein [Coriobacteriia bacterium]